MSGRYNGRVGTIVIVNDSGSHREYGVAWKAVTVDDNRPGGLARQGRDTTWFAPDELTIQ